MIRKAEMKDVQKIADVLRAFRNDTVAPDYLRGPGEPTRASEYFIVRNIPHTFVAVDGEEVVGVLISHIGAMPLLSDIYLLEEVCWYVMPSHRHTTLGYRLMKAWKEYGLDLKEQGKVKAVLMHTMSGSPVDMERHGCVALQTTFEVK